MRPVVAVEKLRQLTRSRNGAKRIIVEYLKAGDLASRGRRVKNLALMTLVDPSEIGDYSTRVHEDIPADYWGGARSFDSKFWNWSAGYFICPEDWDNDNMGFVEVQFKEKDINAIFAQMISRGSAVAVSKGGHRDPSWYDWVAAAVILGHEQQINPTMKQRDLLDRIDAKLQAWGLKEGKPNSTVASTASAILRRYQTNPPVKPLISREIAAEKP